VTYKEKDWNMKYRQYKRGKCRKDVGDGRS